MSEVIEDLRGTVSKLHYQAPAFCAGKIKLPGTTQEVSFAGKIHVCLEQVVHLKGCYVVHARFGRQFDARSIVTAREIDGDGLLAWLEAKGQGLGIGPAKAKRILAHFADEFAATLEADPKAIADFARVPLEGIEQLSKYYATHKEETAIYSDLAGLGLTDYLCTIIIQKYHGASLSVIRENPYRLADEVSGIGFAKADEIAANVGIIGDNPHRVRAAVLHAATVIQDRGSTCSTLDSLVDEAAELLSFEGANDHAIHCVAKLVADGELVKVEELYAMPQMAAVERNIAEFFKTFNAPRDWGIDVEAGIKKHGDFLDDDQKDAVRTGLTCGVVCITGPAGAGKSTVCNTIVKICEDLDNPRMVDVALCAPTGKAARRMEEIIGRSASTIHRLLKYQPPSTWGYNEEKPLMDDIVIADEWSMTDSVLAWNLMRSIRRKSALIMVGDHNQLPPVGAGSSLRDAIAHKLVPIIDLHTVHRAAGNLRKNSAMVLTGKMMPTAPRKENGKPEWIVDDRHVSEETVTAMLDNLFVKILPEMGYDPISDVQFMVPRKKNVTLCSEILSERFQVLHQRRLGREVPPTPPKRRAILYEGDKVIQGRNNYNLGIMNGTQGIVMQTSPRLVVKFENMAEPLEIPNDMKGDIDLAYWLTVHRYQGSQCPVAVFLCMGVHLGKWDAPMLHRNLAYTALSRARELAIVVGDNKGIKGAMAQTVEDKRLTLLPIYARGVK